WCVAFAFANRSLMMDRIKKIFEEKISEKGEKISFEPMINIAHNYAALENHFGRDVWVHRKGATSSKEGEMGVIAGSQGTKSYIVRGKGNLESFMSCSHGAGRRLGRKQAERELNLEEEQRILDEQGILHAVRGKKDLDEATGAYKDISVVMKNQEDLVDILEELTPIAVVK
ncbi:MAG: RtcB family protein, partial [Candidatus Moranbacteria bacterium]|nr:RtcB family protein [Candidatus Moranbacteria bacterium]